MCHEAHGRSFPEGLTRAHFEHICRYNAWEWHEMLVDRASSQILFQHGLNEILDLMTLFQQDKLDYRVSIFAVHDTSLVALLCAFDLRVDVIPQYAATLVLELHKDEQETHVRVCFEGQELLKTSLSELQTRWIQDCK